MNLQLLIFFSDLLRHPRRIIMSSRVHVRNELRPFHRFGSHDGCRVHSFGRKDCAQETRESTEIYRRRYIVSATSASILSKPTFPPPFRSSTSSLDDTRLLQGYRERSKEKLTAPSSFAVDEHSTVLVIQDRRNHGAKKNQGEKTRGRHRGSTSSRHWNSETRNTLRNRRYRSNRKSDK